MLKPSLAIVIHTEEEFDWNGGFFTSNNKVTHGKALITFCESIIAIGGKITFALDYAFVNSDDGQKVIKHFNDHHPNDIEFATHLHPWVNPPHHSNAVDEVSNLNSYPGNLAKEDEFNKLKALTDKITEVCGAAPVTYLAGRYGIGNNTLNTLQQLGYQTDVSISPFSDFSHQQGPDFSHYSNQVHEQGGLTHWPHTTAIVALFSFVARYFNNNPARYEGWQKKSLIRIALKLLRVKRQRLSPEGFALSDLKKITNTQLALGHNNLIFSFHSPSVKAGLTPYVGTERDAENFLTTTTDYINWLLDNKNGKTCLVKKLNTEKMNND